MYPRVCARACICILYNLQIRVQTIPIERAGVMKRSCSENAKIGKDGFALNGQKTKQDESLSQVKQENILFKRRCIYM